MAQKKKKTVRIAILGTGSMAKAHAEWYRKILSMDDGLYSVHRSLGSVLMAAGKTDLALPHFLTAIKLKPGDADTHTVTGMALLEKDRAAEAEQQFREALRLQPTNSVANYQMAAISQGRKQIPEAVAFYKKALLSQPDWPETLNNLAWLLAASPDASIRSGPQAVSFAEKACELTHQKEPLFLGTLAAAYAEAGRFPEAIASAQKAHDLAVAAGMKEVAQKNSELLEVYRSGKPYHESP